MWGPGLPESDAVTFFAVLQFHGSQRTKQLEIFEFSRADSNTFLLLYSRASKIDFKKNRSFDLKVNHFEN